MKGYIAGIQRFLDRSWKYNGINLWNGPIFNDAHNKLVVVMDNLFAKKQAAGAIVRSHNHLSREDLKKLYTSESLRRDRPGTFQARFVLMLHWTLRGAPNAPLGVVSY